MLLVLNIIIVSVLMLMIVQDLKYRLMHVSLPVILFITALVKFFYLEHSLMELGTTVTFLGLVLLGLWGYLSLKSRKVINPIDQSIGLGDIAFFVAIIPLFYVTTYMIYFSSGMLFAIICHLVFTKDKERNVPLAGYLSVYLLGATLVNLFIEKELFYTHFIL